MRECSTAASRGSPRVRATRFFPLYDISRTTKPRTSLQAFRQLLAMSRTGEEFTQRVYQDFERLHQRRLRQQGHRALHRLWLLADLHGVESPHLTSSGYPLYKRPADLVVDPTTGETRGRMVNGTVQTYPTRAQIESSNMLAGTEFIWLRDPLDAYIIQVNGSAKLTMTDGSTRYIGFAGTNGAQYTSVGKLLVEDEKIDANHLSLPTLREYFHQHPEDLAKYTQRNDRYVFFQDYGANLWPAGSLGLKVTPFRTLATDKTIFPRGCLALSQTNVPSGADDQMRLFDQFMLDQDAGGAIRAAGRSDIYMGVGTDAELLAGRQFSEGRLYYFFLKPERVAAWKAQFSAARCGKPMV